MERHQRAAIRLEGAMMASESCAHVLTEALHSMQEARFLLLDTDHLRPWPRTDQALAVLERGIDHARTALNLDAD